MHALFAGFVRRGADHTPFGRVAITAADHWAPLELWAA